MPRRHWYGARWLLTFAAAVMAAALLLAAVWEPERAEARPWGATVKVERVRCVAITKRGIQCKRTVALPESLCWQHRKR